VPYQPSPTVVLRDEAVARVAVLVDHDARRGVAEAGRRVAVPEIERLDDVAVRVDGPCARQMPVSPLSTASVCPVT
jgi:hypothetical protein